MSLSKWDVNGLGYGHPKREQYERQERAAANKAISDASWKIERAARRENELEAWSRQRAAEERLKIQKRERLKEIEDRKHEALKDSYWLNTKNAELMPSLIKLVDSNNGLDLASKRNIYNDLMRDSQTAVLCGYKVAAGILSVLYSLDQRYAQQDHYKAKYWHDVATAKLNKGASSFQTFHHLAFCDLQNNKYCPDSFHMLKSNSYNGYASSIANEIIFLVSVGDHPDWKGYYSTEYMNTLRGFKAQMLEMRGTPHRISELKSQDDNIWAYKPPKLKEENCSLIKNSWRWFKNKFPSINECSESTDSVCCDVCCEFVCLTCGCGCVMDVKGINYKERWSDCWTTTKECYYTASECCLSGCGEDMS